MYINMYKRRLFDFICQEIVEYIWSYNGEFEITYYMYTYT